MMNCTEHTELPPIGSNVSVRLLEGVIVTGVVTGHGHKDGKPTFDFDFGHRTHEGQILKASKWAWPEQVQRNPRWSITIDSGVDEASQESSFMNATLQSVGPNVAMSIATSLSIPDAVTVLGDEAIEDYVGKVLSAAQSSCEGLSFHVQLGPSLDAMRQREVSDTKETITLHNSGEIVDAFNYQLLARLKQDCEYYLGHGNRAKKHLWAGDEAEQIAKMKSLYASFSEKPEWISLEEIEQYKAKMLNAIGRPVEESQGEADAPKNALGMVAAKPFYIWANDDCANKSDSFSEAKNIRLAMFNEGGESVHIVDADGVEVVDSEIECHEGLAKSGYFAGARNPKVKPGYAGAFMVNDPRDPDGFAIVGDDVGALILEAQAQLIHPDD